MSKQEQLSVVLGYIFNKMMHEKFIGLYLPDALNAESLAKSIVSNVKDLDLDLNLCVGQGYDGASVMRGNVRGVNALIQGNEAPLANYIHCFNHRLNLVIVDVLKNVQQAVDFFIFIQKIYLFISGSAVHIIGLKFKRK